MMKIDYENVPETEEGESFKTESRLIIQAVFANPMTPAIYVANETRLRESLKEQLAKSGYVYERSNLTYDTTQKGVQGYICTVKGPAGDGPTLEKWRAGGMVARFTIPVENGKIWAGAAS